MGTRVYGGVGAVVAPRGSQPLMSRYDWLAMSVLDRRPPAGGGGGPASRRGLGSTSSRQGRTASSGGCLSKALTWGDREWTR